MPVALDSGGHLLWGYRCLRIKADAKNIIKQTRQEREADEKIHKS